MLVLSQFTKKDYEYHPDITFDKEYLIFREVATGLSKEICSYGYRDIQPNGNYKWVKIKEAESMSGGKITSDNSGYEAR